MKADELENIRIIQQRDRRPKVSAEQFTSGGDRTLIYGYTVERDTFHVYVKDGMLHRFIYRRNFTTDTEQVVSYESAATMRAEDLSPSKAIYWEHSDYEAAWFLATQDVYMHFKGATVGGQPAESRGQWAGVVYDPQQHFTIDPPRTYSE